MWCNAVFPSLSLSSHNISLSFIIIATNLVRCVMQAWQNTEIPNSSFWWIPAPWRSKRRAKDTLKCSLLRSQTRRIGVRMRESGLLTLQPTFVRKRTCRGLRRIIAWWRVDMTMPTAFFPSGLKKKSVLFRCKNRASICMSLNSFLLPVRSMVTFTLNKTRKASTLNTTLAYRLMFPKHFSFSQTFKLVSINR